MARVLLLDVMDTLVVDPFFRVIPGFFGMSMPELLARKHPTAWLQFERGEISEDEYLDRMFLDRRSFDHAAFLTALEAAYEYVPGIAGLLEELSVSGIERHALSNYPSWSNRIDRVLGLGSHVPWTFVSWKTGLRKPDRESYLHACSELGVDPRDVVFVDDREVNCAAAEELGMESIRFVSAESLRSELVRTGLL